MGMTNGLKMTVIRTNDDNQSACCVLLSEASWLERYRDYANDPTSLLSESELHYFSFFKSERRKQSYLMGRLCAKQACLNLVSIEKDCLFSSIEIKKGVFNFPVVVHPLLPNIQVSISHVNGSACAIAFSERHPMSIDVELLDDKRCRTMEKKLEDGELDCRESFFSADHHRVSRYIKTRAEFNSYFNLVNWTAKESLSKVLRTGLMCPTHLYEVTSCKVLLKEDFIEIYDAFDLEERGFVFVSLFKHFSQYKVISFLDIKLGQVISICLPRQSKLKKALSD